MKHFSASLIGQSNQVDDTAIDSRLLIGANDSIEIGAANTSSSTGVGLIITTTDAADKYLDGSGQERLLADIAGTEVVTALHVPISNAAGTAYVDSQIRQSAVGDDGTPTITIGDTAGSTTAVTGHLTVGGNTTLTGNLTVNGTTTTINSTTKAIADQYTEVNSPVDGAAYVAGQAGGLISVNTATTSGSGTAQTHVAATAGGIRFNPNPAGDGTVAARWELNNEIADASTNANINGDANWTAIGTGALTGVQAGQGIAIESAGTVDGLTGTAADPVISVNLTADAAGAGGLAFTAVSGTGNDTLGIDANGITEQMLNVPGSTPGIAEDVLTLVDAAAGTFGWVSRSTIANAGAGTVRKITQDITASGSTDQTYVVDTTTSNSGIADSDFGINVQVVCYEDVSVGSDNSSLRQFIPQSVTVTAAAVTVVVPAGGVKGRIVITG